MKKQISRKDSKGYVLRVGESQRKDGTYVYSFTDANHNRHHVYAQTLVALREKERQLRSAYDEGLDPIKAKKVTLNDAIERYLENKTDLKITTRSNYEYVFNNVIKDTFGKRKIADIRYSDVKQYYVSLLKSGKYACSIVEGVHTLINPALTMAKRDGLIKDNPASGVMKDVKRSSLWTVPKRRSLSIHEQKLFMDYLRNNFAFAGWRNVITVLLGTGMRIGECLGLRWEDLDFEKRLISVNHNLAICYPDKYKTDAFTESAGWLHIQTPKTKAGERIIPMIEDVFQAFIDEYEIQSVLGFCKQKIGSFEGFVFTGADQCLLTPAEVNKGIHRIIRTYNDDEMTAAKETNRKPDLLPDFSAHVLRHTFCTRLCENESNIRVIQDIMGHSDITTTMNIYADVTGEKKSEIMANLDGKIIL